MSNLYELSKELQIINSELSDSGGVFDDEIERKLDELNIAVKDKIEGLGRWIANLDGEDKALDAEITRLEGRRTAVTARKTRLHEYIKTSMERADIKKIEGVVNTFTIVSNPPSLEIVDKEKIPAAYITVKTENVVDKKRLLQDLKEGAEIEGVKLVTEKTHLRIK